MAALWASSVQIGLLGGIQVDYTRIVLGSLVAGWIIACLGGYGLGAAEEGFSEGAGMVLVDRADATLETELDRAKSLLAARQWEEAIRSLRELTERAGSKLVAIDRHRLIPLQTYVQLLLCQLPADGLAVYRRQVDPLAQRWYEEGRRQQDRRLLRQVVEQAFVSSWADDALWLLGEMALEAGEYAEARWYWERLIPGRLFSGGQVPEPTFTKQPAGAEGSGPAHGATLRGWLAYPDPAIDVAAVRARLVCTSILEGSLQRAQEELRELARLHPEAEGRLAGRQVRFVEALAEMLSEASRWPRWKDSGDWPTFAGNPERNGRVSQVGPVGPVRWRAELPGYPSGQPEVASSAAPPAVAESLRMGLGYYPVVVGRWIFVATLWEIYGWDLWTGRPLWHQGRIYRDPMDITAQSALVPRHLWGRPRCTLTVHGNRLYARMGSPVTAWGQDSSGATAGGYIVCLDLEAEGRLLWKQSPEGPGWAFEGTPVAESGSVYVAMRRSELGPHVHAYVTCFDAETGRVKWRTFVCGAEPPVRNVPQTTHQLLTLQGQTLYYNTNLGAVAALRTSDGQIQWIRLYPRSRLPSSGPIPRHWARQLTPCVWDRGLLYVAPADTPSIFCLDAATGQLLWQTGPELADAVHLLGIWEDRLIATGERVYGIATTGARRGQVVFRWPDGPDRLGYGRGVLAQGQIWWPTRDTIHLLDARTGQPIREILLRPLQTGGGNLVAAGGLWIIAGENQLVCLGPQSSTSCESEPAQTTPQPTGITQGNGK
ncbi:MAG: PQQ-binding-like beta-propeller repeat protein [Thermoguttaceae bacterium]|nr:PQQ-binding-like beta-propeller repeat protein [Thermoguttaceae bacterium]MDW8039133.1 PQQ-binding-like beta-propeller repeat protein [Thermoguttaceae bacterium]